jgi:DNA modification methylase
MPKRLTKPTPKSATLTVKRLPLAKLKAHPRNPRQHPEPGSAEWQTLRRSLESEYFDPLVWNKRNGLLVSGHLRTKILAESGYTEADCVVVDWDEQTHLARMIAANKLQGENDDKLLAELFRELMAAETDLDLTGFTQEEMIDFGFLESNTEPDDDHAAELIDRAAELQKIWKVNQGDVWLLGDHRLSCGDCRVGKDPAALMGNDTVNLAFTSPPYASQRKYDESSGFKPILPGHYVDWFKDVQVIIARYLTQDGSFFLNIKEAADGGEKLDYVKRLVLRHKDEWGWKWIEEYCWPRPALPLDPKTSRRFKNGWESVFHFSRTTDFKFRPDEVRHELDGCFTYKDQKKAGKQICDGGQGAGGGAMSPVNQHKGLAYPSNMLPNFGGAKVVGHSAAFPVGLPSFFIEGFSDAGDIVYEPFSGSGTTLIACEQLQRKCRAMELSPAYVAVALQRFKDLTGKTPKLLK